MTTSIDLSCATWRKSSHSNGDGGNCLEVAEDFPGAAAYDLQVNYRCPPAVVDAAVHLLGHNRYRVPKKLRAGSVA